MSAIANDYIEDMKQNKLRVALYQQDIVWEDPQANFDKVEKAFSMLSQPVDILVVPETFSTGFGDHMARQAEKPCGATFGFAHAMAQKHNALFVGSWTVCQPEGVYNRMHLVCPDGSFEYYDKGHTFRMSSEASQVLRGQRRVTVEWRGWRIRPAVCYDLRFPLWLRNSADWDYDLLMVCANWPGSRHHAWTTLLKARAIENLSYAVGCNRTGCDSTGIEYAGCSAIVDFKGLPMCQIEPRDAANDTSERVIVAELDAEKLDTFREHWPFNLDFDIQ
ncbi:MAG: nitrilase family protein [Bacteroidales bacterium]|nr:nitrilase family protein [Bacteroidales bacterium]